FLRRAGLFVEPVWDGCWGEEGFIPYHIGLERETAAATYTAAFSVPEGSLDGSALVFVPPKSPALTLPITPPSGEAARLPVLASDDNEIVELTVHDFVEPTKEVREQLASHLSPERELVALRVSASAKGRPFDFSYIDYYCQLIAEETFPCSYHYRVRGRRMEGWPVWRGNRWLLPGVTDHGVLLYAVPRKGAALRLEVHLPKAKGPDRKPLSKPVLRLPLAEGDARPMPEPRASLEEKGWQFRLLGLRAAGTEDRPELALDVWVRAPPGDKGAEFGRDHLTLMDQTGGSQSWRATGRRYEVTEKIYVPAGAVRRMEFSYGLYDPGVRLWLRLPKQCPSSLITIPNPWVPADRERLRLKRALEVTKAPEQGVPYRPPPLLPEPEAKGIEGVGLTGAQINEAIRKGALFLIGEHKDGFNLWDNEEALVILALLHSGELENHPEVLGQAVECLEKRKIKSTYDAALTIMGLAFVDPDRFRPRIVRLVQLLVDGQTKEGGWSYLRDEADKIEPEAPEAAASKEKKGGGIEVVGGDPIPGWPRAEKSDA
ncbi:MAG: hypothetical protein ACE5H5_06990, partial [Nitrospinota bacterium]